MLFSQRYYHQKKTVMKKNTITRFLPVYVGLFLMFCFATCTPDPTDPVPADSDSTVTEIPPIDYTPEVNDPVTNDFTMLKACIGSNSGDAANLLTQNGFILNEDLYTKTVENVTKNISIWPSGVVKQGELYVKGEELPVMMPIFKQWMQEFHASSAFPKLVRSSYSMRVDGNSQSFDSYEAFMSALGASTSYSDYLSINFSGNDIYSNVYEIFLNISGHMKWVELRIYNARAGQPSDEFPESDLPEEDLHKNILISKVDYLTFRPRGFYAMNVQNPVSSGNEIPFVAQYQAPGDFGWFKLFYQTTDNLLAHGSIVWMGCGELEFPESFRAGQKLSNGLPYPGQTKIAFINDEGQYCTVSAAQEVGLQRIWQTLSKQEEFQHYYNNTHKKVAVYLYTPSVGIGNPADWYYLVFTEQ
jgi:hypothetical protein